MSVRHGRGATVRPSEDWDVFDPEILAAVLRGDGGNDLLAEYVECRRVIEVAAAGLAAERATPERLDRAAAALARMEESAGRDGPGRGGALPRGRRRVPPGGDPAPPATGRWPTSRGGSTRAARGALPARAAGVPPRARAARAPPHLRRRRRGDKAEARRAMNDHLDTVAGYLTERAAATRSRRGDDRRRIVTVTSPHFSAGAAGPLRDASIDVRLAPKLGARSPGELIELVQGAVGAIASTDPFDATVLAAAPDLRVIARVGVGTDSIDLAAAADARRRGHGDAGRERRRRGRARGRAHARPRPARVRAGRGRAARRVAADRRPRARLAAAARRSA